MRKLLIAGLAFAAACGNAGSELGIDITETGNLSVIVYLDRDGSRAPNIPGLDVLFNNARVALLPLSGSDTVDVTPTVAGVARFENVPLGLYRIGVTQTSVGDSVEIQDVDPDTVRIQSGVAELEALVRIGYPEVSIRAARGLPAGRRVFIRGFVLAGVQSFRDTTSHVADSSSQIRLTRVTLQGNILGNAPGDSVSVLGFTSSRAGQPTLDNAVIARFAVRPPPVALPASTLTASNASTGVLDAGLVLITGAIISDTATIAPDFRVVASDGTGNLTIILDANIAFARGNFRPGRSMNVRGVLVPDGAGAWRLKPREVGDVAFNN